MVLKPGMVHQGLNVYKICIHYDPWLTLINLKTMSNLAQFVLSHAHKATIAYLKTRSDLVAYAFERGKL